MEEIKKQLAREAICLNVGGFRPGTALTDSWIGKVMLAATGERWPIFEGNPMIPLCQINLKELPYRPDILADIEFITVFLDHERLPLDKPNGDGWCLRAYKDINELVALTQPIHNSLIRPMPMRGVYIVDDFPQWEDDDFPLRDLFLDESNGLDFHAICENAIGNKLGGWPTLLQGGLFSANFNQDPAIPRYAFQIDSISMNNFSWGYGGIGYFGRGTAAGTEDNWYLEWQSL